MLNSEQRSAVGVGYERDIFHPSYASLISVADEDSFDEEEEEQTYAEFVEIGKRVPNREGTGRWKLNQKRKKILLISFNNGNNVEVQNMKRYLSAYFCLEVDVLVLHNAIDQAEKTLTIRDDVYDFEVLSVTTKVKKKKKTVELVEVFSLFDILVHLVKEPYLTSVALVDFAIGEMLDEGPAEVLGRACGDRVCCVSMTSNTSFREKLTTATHELLHTVGFDHCNSFKCVMNAIASDTSLFLSPPNLRKMKAFHKITADDNCGFVIARYERLLATLETLEPAAEFARDCAWLRSMLEKLRLLVAQTVDV